MDTASVVETSSNRMTQRTSNMTAAELKKRWNSGNDLVKEPRNRSSEWLMGWRNEPEMAEKLRVLKQFSEFAPVGAHLTSFLSRLFVFRIVFILVGLGILQAQGNPG